MTTIHTLLISLTLGLLLTVSRSHAQSDSDMARAVNVIDKEFNLAKTQAIKNTSTRFNTRLTPPTSGLPGFASAIENFIPKYQLVSALLGDNDKQPITMDFGYLIFDQEGDNDTKLKVVLNRGSELSKDIKAAAGAEIATALQRNINEADDVTVSFSYNVTNLNYGRSFEENRALFKAVTRSINSDPIRVAAISNVANHLGELHEAVALDADKLALFKKTGFVADGAECDALAKKSDGSSDSTINNECRKLNAEFERLRKRNATLLDLFQPTNFATLVSNQPQFQISASARIRDDLVGASEYSFKMAYETAPGKNINRLRKSMGGRVPTVQDYQSYVGDTGSPLSDAKFNFSLQYSHIDDQRFGATNVAFFKQGGDKLTGSVGFGKSIVYNKDNEPIVRFDGELKFEEFLGDTKGNDRVIAVATFTRKINDQLSIPISLEYANKSEFFSEDSKPLSANLAFKYEFDWAK